MDALLDGAREPREVVLTKIRNMINEELSVPYNHDADDMYDACGISRKELRNGDINMDVSDLTRRSQIVERLEKKFTIRELAFLTNQMKEVIGKMEEKITSLLIKQQMGGPEGLESLLKQAFGHKSKD